MATNEAKVKFTADTTAFNSAIKSANSTLTELRSALKLNQTQMTSTGSSTDALKNKLKLLEQEDQALAQKKEALNAKLQEAVKYFGEDSTEAAKLRTQLNNVETQSAKVAQEIDSTNQELKEQEQEAAKSETALNKLTSTISSQESEMAQLKQQYTNAVLEYGETSEEAQELAGKITTLNGDLQENKAKLKDATDAADNLTKSEDELGDTGESAGSKMASGFEAAYQALVAAGLIEAVKKLGEAIKSCIQTAAEFESQMSTVKALSGATSDQMDQLTAAAKQMGATTSYTATEAGEALEYMALAGWDTDEMLDGLSGVINLAAAAGEDLGTTCDIVTDALTAFGYSASESGHFADVLAAASSNSNTTVSELGEAFKQVGTTAGTFGYSIDDVSEALGLMANAGIKGSSAGTALSTTLTRMSGTNATATAQMEKWGLSLTNANGTSKDLNTVLSELRTAFQENCQSTEDMQVAAYNLAGQKGMKGLMAIVNASDEDFQALSESISTCDGAAEEMAETKLDNFQGAVTLLKSAWDGLATTMGETALPALTNIVEAITNVISKLNDFLTAHENIAKIIAIVAAALVGLTAAFAAMAVAATAGKKAVEALNEALTDSTLAPYVLAISAAVAGVTALIAIFKSIDTEQKQLRQTTKELTQEAKDQTAAYEEQKETTAENTNNNKQLVSQLEQLLSVQNKDAATIEAINSLTGQLNDNIDGLGLTYDSETDSINMSNSALESLVDTQGQADEYTDAVNRQSEALAEQADLQAQAEELQNKINEAMGEGVDTTNMSTAELMAYNQQITANATQVAGWQRQLDEINQALEANNADLEEVNSFINDYSAATDEAANKDVLITNTVEDLGETLITLQQAYDDTYDSAYDSMSGQFDLWEQADEIVTTSFDDMMSALESQQKYWEEYSDNLDNLKGRQIDGLDELLEKYGDNAQMVASMADLTDDELNQMIAQYGVTNSAMAASVADYSDTVTGYSTYTKEAIDEAIATLQSLDQSDEAKQLALQTLQGYVSGLDEESGEVDDETVQVAQDLINQFADELEIGSPSKVFEDMGSDTMTGYINGVNGEDGSVKSALQTLAQNAISAFQKNSTDQSLKGTGTNTIQGYINGSNGQNSSLLSKMQSMASGAISSFQKNSTSTSLKTTGTNTIQGYMTGTANKLSDMTAKMTSHAKSAITSFTNNATSSSLKSAGSNTIQGFINGLNSKSGTLYSRMASIASSALSNFKKKLGIASPSKEMYSAAEFTGEGFIIGIEDQENEVAAAMASLADGASSAFNNGLAIDSDTVDLSGAMTVDNTTVMQDYVSTVLQNSMNGMMQQLSSMIQTIADRPIVLNINGHNFCVATAGDMDGALGTRTNLTARGLAL